MEQKVDLSARPHVVILGAGPAGVGAAFRLMQKGTARVTVLEQQDKPGGNAGSFLLDGVLGAFGGSSKPWEQNNGWSSGEEKL